MFEQLVSLVESLGLMAGLVLLYGVLDRRFTDRPRRLRSLGMGLLFGGAASIAMLLPIELQPGVIFDVRSVPMILAATFGGPWAAVVAAGLAFATRAAIGGAGVEPALVSSIGIVLISLGLAFARRRRADFGPLYFAAAGALGIVPVALGLLMLGADTALTILESIALPWTITVTFGCLVVGSMLLNEDLRRQTERRLEQSRAEAQRANRAKSEFLSQMSHELRTPMTAIMGSLDLLALDRLRPEQHQLLDASRRSAHHMLQLLNDLLDLAKIEANRLELATEPVSLPSLLGDLQSLFGGQADAKGLAFHLEQDAELPSRVLTDGVRLRQILTNLIGNAIKFTDSGFIRVSATVVRDAQGALRLRFAVRDTGIGIPEERQAAVFRVFEQADTTTEREFGGSGLGLAISRDLARKMGGDIQLDSREGLGSCFTVDLPLRKAEPPVMPAPGAAGSTDELVGDRPLAGRRILLAEDVEANRAIISQMLMALGAQVDTVENGKRAVELAAAGYDAILMDMHMPVMDGSEATRHIRRLDDGVATTPIIALTADITPDRKRGYHAAGLDAFLTKPVDWSDLVALLRRVMPERDAAGTDPSAPLELSDAGPLAGASSADAAPEIATLHPGTATLQEHDVLELRVVAALESSLGKQAVSDLLRLFPETARGSLSDLETRAQDGPAGDLNELRVVAHSLKGAAANFGFERLRHAVCLLQEAEDRDEAQALLPVVRREISAACAAVTAYCGDPAAPAARSHVDTSARSSV